MVLLVAGANGEGFLHALAKAFAALGLDDKRPGKSAFSQLRKKISFTLFRDAYEELTAQICKKRGTFKGLFVYAIDGQQHILRRTKDIVASGFNGRAIGQYKESYLPRGYLTHVYDVLNGISRSFTFNPHLNEQADARNLIRQLEINSLTIYDRLYFGIKMVEAHIEHGSRFLMRCRSNCHVAVTRLLASKKKTTTAMIGGKKIFFTKIWHAREKRYDVYATNLPPRMLSSQLILQLYRMRWKVETSFKEMTSITKSEQWHSKSYNGILQELYALMWLINATKGIMKIAGVSPLDPTKRVYRKANFKLIFNLLAQRLHEVWYRFRELIA
jgi:IS4 transposase